MTAMKLDANTIAEAAQRIGIKPDELAAVLQRGTAVHYKPADYLFHESAPRQWLGILMEGGVDLVRGQHGQRVLIGLAQPGAMLAEGVMLDDTPHSTSAVTHQGAQVWQISRAELDTVRAENPEVFYRLVGQIARRLSDRLRAASERLARESGPATLTNVRREHDSLGERDVPNHAYYGVQTVRAVENFPFSGIHVRHYEHFVCALACVKKAAALANAELGALDRKVADAIANAFGPKLLGKGGVIGLALLGVSIAASSLAFAPLLECLVLLAWANTDTSPLSIGTV
jgi:aspartate ammonia-lyase